MGERRQETSRRTGWRAHAAGVALLLAPGLVACAAGPASSRPVASTVLVMAEAPATSPEIASAPALAVAHAKGWGYLVDKLVADGVAPATAAGAFADPRMPAFTGLGFSLRPRESGAMYHRFLGAESVAVAQRCRERHASALDAAARAHGVPAGVVAAILHVESGCGRNTGSAPILHRLARLAMANEPGNVAENLARHAASPAGKREPALAERVQTRARYLEDTFYPEVRATFDVAARAGADPLALRGSSAGAFGYPQFLPQSYLRFGVDANGDGQVSLYDIDDAAASCARYLAGHGWRDGLTRAEQRAVIWRYNRSDAYVDTVLRLAARLEAASDTSRVAADER